jgi:electron transfer flavoprotein alpha subunit
VHCGEVMPTDKTIMIIGEVGHGELLPITRELLSAGRFLADEMGGKVSLTLTGQDIISLSQKAIGYGADVVHAIEDPLLDDDHPDAHLVAVEKVCRQSVPSIILLGRTLIGSDMGPRLAFRLGTVLIQDCVELSWDPHDGGLLATRPVYGGVAMATVKSSGNPQMVTIRPKIYESLEYLEGRTGDVVSIKPDINPSAVKSKVVDRVIKELEGIDLEDANVVIGGGRGLGGPEPFKFLDELAALLNGAVGASRAVCDAGWVPPSYQIGLTGKTITPDLYITVGISGASQHMAGCSGAKNIVAINKDSESYIFKEARYGVTGDWAKVLPSFIATVRELLNS